MVSKKILLKDILSFLNGYIIKVDGLENDDVNDIYVDNLADAQHTNKTTLDWINITNKSKQLIAENSIAKVLIVDPTIIYSNAIKKSQKIFIYVESPRMVVAKIANNFHIEKITRYF